MVQCDTPDVPLEQTVKASFFVNDPFIFLEQLQSV